MTTPDPHHHAWRKSSYSSGNGGSCLETRPERHHGIAVRDSKEHGAGPILTISHDAWRAFIDMATS
ncbi:DUF397 domain-containing protein [Streptomyces radicis]|uniref:DUF397 domain-containing protein n=1 Tax=Streptomyces radicis TaxID=1750517 RepID=A0A3A9VRT4_9ACTN|nr:DUF397 domain-containing protein [Streptomyces radicis]RKN03781.1 DUF397 domain-containing protein [Streptomyces radicis]RKN13848.1 DUF397 domain-containing protein [Streptomyces radicis]